MKDNKQNFRHFTLINNSTKLNEYNSNNVSHNNNNYNINIDNRNQKHLGNPYTAYHGSSPGRRVRSLEQGYELRYKHKYEPQ